MTTPSTPADTHEPGAHAGTTEPDPAQPPDRATVVEPACRGVTSVAEQAVEKIATRLVAEADGAGGTARTVLGVSVGQASTERDAEVRARLRGRSAVSLLVRCSVPYPTPVAEATETLRTELVSRVGELTGLAVQRVDIDVATLVTAHEVRVQ